RGMRLWPSAAKRRNSSRVMSASWSEEGSNEQRQTRRPGRQEKSGAPAPTGQGLDDFHPLSAGEHHERISSVGQKESGHTSAAPEPKQPARAGRRAPAPAAHQR